MSMIIYTNDSVDYWIESIAEDVEKRGIGRTPSQLRLIIDDGVGEKRYVAFTPLYEEKMGMLDTSQRTICSILEDLRKAYETRNFSYVPGLIEEGQYRANRMEDAIEKYGGWEGVRTLERRRRELKEEVQKLQEKKEKLETEGYTTDGDSKT